MEVKHVIIIYAPISERYWDKGDRAKIINGQILLGGGWFNLNENFKFEEIEGFTKQIKKAWIEALESGKYTQAQKDYINTSKGSPEYCCLAVLDKITEEKGIALYWEEVEKVNEVYTISDLIDANDTLSTDFVPDYRNVLPLIRNLKTVD